MKIKINSIEQKPFQIIETLSSEEFIKRTYEQIYKKSVKKFLMFSTNSRRIVLRPDRMSDRYIKHYMESEEVTKEEAVKAITEEHREKLFNSGESFFVSTLKYCFSNHIPFALCPEVVWQVILQEIAVYIKNNSEKPEISNLFTNSKERQTIRIQVGMLEGTTIEEWLEVCDAYKEVLKTKIPNDFFSTLTPKLSTASAETEFSHLISIMDASSSFYKYEMFTLCGIPEIKINGTVGDWSRMIEHLVEIEKKLPELKFWITKLLIPTLVEIRDTLSGQKEIDQDFWSSIFKLHSGSGGSDAEGWFNTFFAHEHRKPKAILKRENSNIIDLTYFPTSMSFVPVEWNRVGETIPLVFVGGIIGIELEDGFLTPKIGALAMQVDKTD